MNQTGGLDKKANQTGTIMRGTGADGTQQAQLEFNPYAEEPRPNLFNIVKNIRENKVFNIKSIIVISGCIHESSVRCKAKRERT